MYVKKGTVIALTQGEYSDYYLMGHAKALKDFYLQVEAVIYRSKDSSGTGGPDSFAAYLIREGVIEPYDGVIEIHIGSYGRIDPDIHTNKLDGGENV